MKTLVHALAGFAGAVVGMLIISHVALNTQEDSDNELDKSTTEELISKYYFSVMGIKAKGARSYTSITHVIHGGCPSEANIEQVRQKVLAHNPDFKDCVVLSYMPVAM